MWTSWAWLAHRRAETTKEEEEIEEEEEEEQCVFLSSLPLSSSDSETFIACRRHGTVHSQRRSDRALCWGVGGRKKTTLKSQWKRINGWSGRSLPIHFISSISISIIIPSLKLTAVLN